MTKLDALDSVHGHICIQDEDIFLGNFLVGKVVESLGNSPDVVNRNHFLAENMFVLPEYVISLCQSLKL